MAAPEEILRLVEQYDSHRQAYELGRYKETQLRHEFIDKFFIALGWDVNNERGYAEAYKDVVHEDADQLNGKLLPFLEYNRRRYPSSRASDYLQLESLMMYLNESKVYQRCFDCPGDHPVA